MAIIMIMNWAGIKPEHYEQLRKSVNWEGNIPEGAVFHVSAFDEKGGHVVDIWDTPEDFYKFVENRLMPEVQKLGIGGQPNIEIYPVHAIFKPGISKL